MAEYPYIPREYYSAVMFAAKMVKENGYFNKAVEIASNYYNVSENEVRKHLTARINAGKKTKTNKGIKYKYYIVKALEGTAEGSEWHCTGIEICKATSMENAKKKYTDADFYSTMRNDTGSYYDTQYLHEILGEYATKEDAEKALKGYRQ